MKKAALHNLGCKVNAYETEAMQQLLEEAGYEIVSFHEKADVYVINTCSVTNMAGSQVPPDAASCEENEPGCRGCCSGMLRADKGRGGKAGSCNRYSDRQ